MVDIDGFEKYLFDEELSKNTRESYMFSIKSFAENFDTVSKSNIILWKQDLLTGKSPKTVNLRLSAIGKYCKYKKLNIDFKRVKVQKILSVEDVITIDEYERLLDGLVKDNKIHFAIVVVLLAKTGARISEVLHFKKRDLQKDHIEVTYSPAYASLRGGGFSLKYGNPHSIDELSPCVPRFLFLFYANAILIPSFRMFTAAFVSLS